MYFLLVSVLVPCNILLSFDSVLTFKRPVFVTSVLVFLFPYIKLVYLAFFMVFLLFFHFFFFFFTVCYRVGSLPNFFHKFSFNILRNVVTLNFHQTVSNIMSTIKCMFQI